MKEMTERLAADPELRWPYRAAHEDYIGAPAVTPRGLEGFPSAAACRTG